MVPTNDAALTMAVDRLQWALGRATVRPESLPPVLRALKACQLALTTHEAVWETPQRLFALVDPTLLPFHAVQQRVLLLREEHRTLREQLYRLQAGFRMYPALSRAGFSSPLPGGRLTMHRLSR